MRVMTLGLSVMLSNSLGPVRSRQKDFLPRFRHKNNFAGIKLQNFRVLEKIIVWVKITRG